MIRIFLILSIAFLHFNVDAQNILSPVWKIGTDLPNEINIKQNTSTWHDVNLLLSWERQGFSWMDKKCQLINDFTIPESYKGKNLELSLSLQAEVFELYFNDKKLGGNLPNTFWYDRGKRTQFDIPYTLIKDGTNRISITLNSLSYTGGISHNVVELSLPNLEKNNFVNIDFDKENHLFSATDELEFSLDCESEDNGEITLIINSDFHKKVLEKTFKITAGQNSIPIKLDSKLFSAGFYECITTLKNGTYTGIVEWFGVDVENITSSTTAPKNFDEYWDNALAELNLVDANFKIKKVDSLCSETRNGFVVEMQSLGNLTIRGYYFTPKEKGTYPVILHLPGYGYGFEYLNEFINSYEQIAEFALCVRGHGISKDIFNPINTPTSIWGYKICDKEEQVYRSIYMDCVRGVDFLMSRNEIDKEKIAVSGGSQGGGLAIVTAALCSDKISACTFFDPFPCNIPEAMQIRTQVKNELNNFLIYYNNACSFSEMLAVQNFIDAKNFASKIKCPTYLAVALFDDDIPPHIGFSAYNEIQAKKQYKVYPNDSHLGESNYSKYFKKYIIDLFNE